MTIAQRISAVATRVSAESERRSWSRAIAAHVLSISRHEDPNKIAKAAWPNDDRALMITRGAVSPTTTADLWTYDPVAVYRSLAPGSAALSLFQMGTMLDLSGVSTIYIPSLSAMPVLPVFVGEGMPAPNVDWNFAASIVLGPTRKILLLAAVTAELENSSPYNASTIIGSVLANLANRNIDATAFGTAAATDTTPAGLLYGVPPIAAAAAGPDAMVQDLGALNGAIGDAGIDPTNTIFVAGPREATILQALVGPKFDHQILMTLGLAPKSIAAFSPAGVFSGYADTPTIETGKETAYHFDDAPTDISTAPGVVAAPVKSLYQTDLIGIRVRANCAWAVATGAAQIITDVNW